MAGCGRIPKMDKESDGQSGEMPPVPADQQGPESSADPSAAHPKQNPEYSPKKTQVRKKNVFTVAQLNTLEALFKKQQYLSPSEREQLANQLSLPQQSLKSWFQNRRDKVRHQALNPKKTPVQDQARNSNKGPTKAHQDLQHKQKMEATMRCAQAQKQSYLDSFPTQRPMDSYVLPQGPHSSDMVYCQNVGGPSDSRSGTEVYKLPPESGHNPPSAFHFNLPGTNIWMPVSSVPANWASYDGPSTSSGPRTSQMPIAPYNADKGSSTDTASLNDDETTDSD